MAKQNLRVDVQVFKGDRNKSYIVIPVDKDWIDCEYEIEGNKLLKAKCSDLVLTDGYVLNGKDLYWSVKDMPDDLSGKKVVPVKVVYKK